MYTDTHTFCIFSIGLIYDSAKMLLLFILKESGGVQSEALTLGMELRKWVGNSPSDTKLHNILIWKDPLAYQILAYSKPNPFGHCFHF